MRLITEIRPEDDLSSFGTLLRFAALVYEDEDEGEANAPFAPHNIDGDVAFAPDRASADAAFDAWVETLKAADRSSSRRARRRASSRSSTPRAAS